MREFYRSAELVLTSEHFIILRPAWVQYRIDFLESVYILDHPRTGRARAAQEIRAAYGVHDVSLFRCSDRQTFGQVRRALIRALEGRDKARRYAVSS